jgi:hypothetical protein
MNANSNEVWVPADLDIADKILFGLTFRQVVLLAPIGLGLLGAWRSLTATVPLPLLAAATVPIAAIAFALATVRKDGAGLDQLIWNALKTPKRPVASGNAPASARGPMQLLTGKRHQKAAAPTVPAKGPVRAVSAEGLLDLGPAGWAGAADVGFVNFGLRSGAERASLIAAFARLLHGTDAHLQVCVSTRPVDLSAYLARLAAKRTELQNEPLARAAADHQRWLTRLVASKTLLRREITAVVRCPGRDGAVWAIGQVEAFAAQIGVASHRLDRAELTGRVRYGIDPFGTPESTGRTS